MVMDPEQLVHSQNDHMAARLYVLKPCMKPMLCSCAVASMAPALSALSWMSTFWRCLRCCSVFSMWRSACSSRFSVAMMAQYIAELLAKTQRTSRQGMSRIPPALMPLSNWIFIGVISPSCCEQLPKDPDQTTNGRLTHPW
jgi:hypothetical protein